MYILNKGGQLTTLPQTSHETLDGAIKAADGCAANYPGDWYVFEVVATPLYKVRALPTDFERVYL